MVQRLHSVAFLAVTGMMAVACGLAAAPSAFGASALPDGRGYEMVSPPMAQNGATIGAVESEGNLVQAAENGEALMWGAAGVIGTEPAGNVAPEWDQILSTRGADGWESRDLVTPHEKAVGIEADVLNEYDFFSSNLGLGVIQQKLRSETPLSSPPQEPTIYLRDNASGTYEPLVSTANTPAGTKFGGSGSIPGVKFLDATPDASHVILSSTVALSPEADSKALTTAPNLYEWASGQLQLVSILPNGSSAQSGSGLTLSFGDHSENVRNAISEDGSRVIFEGASQAGAVGRGTHHLYMRDVTSGETVQVDAPEAGAPEEGVASENLFEDASDDGQRIFFSDGERLTSDATTSTTGTAEPDLYMYEVTSGEDEPLAGKLKDLTVDENVGEYADVQGLIQGVSADGSYVYLVATGVLAGNENEAHETAEPGAKNLYMLHDTEAGWTTTFIARLSSEDTPDWAGIKSGAATAELFHMTSRVSENGRYLAFMSDRPLTEYDNEDAISGEPDEEVYLYDAEANRLVCASCDPSRARPEGDYETGGKSQTEPRIPLVNKDEAWTQRWLAGVIPGWASDGEKRPAPHQPRYLSNNGRLFFDGSADLVPQATNHEMDVYEYEPEGVGDCEGTTDTEADVFVERDAGCVGLISGGKSGEESAFLDASDSGGDAFFLTAEKLAAADEGTGLDIYDAHECTEALPCLSPQVIAPTSCEEDIEACQGAATPPPPLAPAATLTQAPGDNVLASPKPKKTKAKKAKPKKRTRAQKLAKALKKCEKKGKKKRAACERMARKKYGAAKKAKRAKNAKNAGKGQSAATRRGMSR